MSLAHIADIRDEETGQIIGFQVGRAAALSDWKFRQEQREFDRLVKRLLDRNAKQNPKRQQQLRDSVARWRAKNPGYQSARRERLRAKFPRFHTCERCGLRQRLEKGRRGKGRRFCSDECRVRHHSLKRNQGINNTRCRERVLAALGREPWLQTKQIAERTGLPFTSVVQVLFKGVRTGLVVTDDAPTRRRYALPGALERSA